MSKNQRVDEGRLEAEHGKLDYMDSSDDEEVRLLPHRKGMDEPDPPGSDIRDGSNASDTQRDKWLLKTEPLQGARPKWNKGERPPVKPDRTGVLDLEATGGVVGRNVEHHGTPTPLLPLERQILQEAEVITPPRRGAHGPGGNIVRNIDEGSIEDDERNTWTDWCDSAFWTAFGIFPSAADGPQPTVAFSDGLFSEEVLTDSAVSVHEELPILALRIFSNVGVTVIPPVVDRPVQRFMDGLVGKDKRMDEVSISWPICDPPIHIGDGDVDLSHGGTEWVCLLYPAGARSVNNGTVAIALEGQRLDHWHSVVWDPGIVGSQALSVCCDCLCLMALFRAVMSLVHDCAEWSVWTGTVSGYCRTIT